MSENKYSIESQLARGWELYIQSIADRVNKRIAMEQIIYGQENTSISSNSEHLS
jgi:hypothetical protein